MHSICMSKFSWNWLIFSHVTAISMKLIWRPPPSWNFILYFRFSIRSLVRCTRNSHIKFHWDRLIFGRFIVIYINLIWRLPPSWILVFYFRFRVGWNGILRRTRVSNFVKIGWNLAEFQRFLKTKYGGRRHLEFSFGTSGFVLHGMVYYEELVCQISSRSVDIWPSSSGF